ncbi:MAG: glycine/betaine ABC transporter substrate-binding protein, partial [Rubrobacter sp.]|nr:glycine/betaine ABC transporter substrate-binding protein [Rubrobacter sp.]
SNLDLVVLEDDQEFFPSYTGAMTARQEVFQENEQLEGLFSSIASELDTETMRQLNERVDEDEEFPDDVAEQWLQENGFIG